MKKNGVFVVILGLLLALLLYLMSGSPKPVIWEPDYTRQSNTPVGTYVLHDFLDNMYGQMLQDVRQPVYENPAARNARNSNYVFINDAIKFTDVETRQLLKYAAGGNNVFISAEEIGGLLSDTLKLGFNDQVYVSLHNDMSVQTALDSGGKPIVNFENPRLRNEDDYVINRISENIAITRFDTANTEVLGRNIQGSADFIRIRHGKGMIYIHTVPAVFANYFLTDPKTASCAFRALSYLPLVNTMWDEHYKSGRVESTDPRRYILSQPSLYIAWVVAAAMLILSILFGLKRRERIVPIVKPLTNTTLEFVEVVGTLYLRQKNHHDILNKKINFFLESIRTRFYVKTAVFDEAFLERVTNLSGVHPDVVRKLFREIERIQFSHTNGDHDLHLIENLIYDFNQSSKR